MSIETLPLDFSKYREPLQVVKTFAAQFSAYINAYPDLKGLSDLLNGYSADLVYLDVELITFLNSIITLKTNSLGSLITMLEKNPTAGAIKNQVNIDYNKIVSVISNISLKLEYELLQIDSVGLHNVAITLKSSLEIIWNKLHEVSDELHHLLSESKEQLSKLNELIKLEGEKTSLSQILLDTFIPIDQLDDFINTVKGIPPKQTNAPVYTPGPITNPIINPGTGPGSITDPITNPGTGIGTDSGKGQDTDTGIIITNPVKPSKNPVGKKDGRAALDEDDSEEFDFVDDVE